MSRHRFEVAERGRRHRHNFWFLHQWWSRGVAIMCVVAFIWLVAFAFIVYRIMSVPVTPTR